MKTLRILLVAVILISLIAFVRATDMQQVLASMRQVGLKFFVLILVTFCSGFCATIGWRYCFGASGKDLSLWHLFIVRVAGEALGLVNPTSVIGGDALKAFLLRKKEIEPKTVLASLLLSRVLMVLTQLLLFTLAIVVLYSDSGTSLQLPQLPPALYVAILVSIPAVIFLARNSWLKDLIRPTAFGAGLARRTFRVRKKMAEVRTELVSLYKNNKKNLVYSSAFFALHWVFGAAEFYFILLFLGVKATLVQAILVDMGVVFFKAAGAFVPGQIGIEEYGNKVMLATIGAPGTEIWVAASILRRARQLFWIAAGLLAYFGMSEKRNFLFRRR